MKPLLVARGSVQLVSINHTLNSSFHYLFIIPIYSLYNTHISPLATKRKRTTMAWGHGVFHRSKTGLNEARLGHVQGLGLIVPLK